MPFVWDEIKSDKNRRDRGKGFEEAERIFDTSHVRRDVVVNQESRYVVYGYIDNVPWAAVFCVRDKDIRVISLRQCNKRERRKYYGQS